MQEHIQNELASFIANCDWEKIAPHFKEDATYRVLDWIGCAVAGEHYPQVEIAQKYFIENGDQGNSTVIGHQTKCSPRTAAFLNGIAGHVCELDDGHRTAIGHPGSIAVPTALALGEHLNASGADVLKAVILGYEVFFPLGAHCQSVPLPDVAYNRHLRDYRRCGRSRQSAETVRRRNQ